MRSALQVRVFKILTAFLLLLASAIPGISVLDTQKAFAANTTYYVSSSTGNDSNNGTSQSTPWKTMAKVSSITFQPGDRILLKSGDSWNEKLTLKGSGTKASPITITSYGTGNKPLIKSGAPNSGVVYGSNISHWLIQGLAVEIIPTSRLLWPDKATGILIEYNAGTVYEGLQIDGNDVYSSSADSNTYGISVQAFFNGGTYGKVGKDFVISNNSISKVGWYAIITGGYDTAAKKGVSSQETYENMYVVGNNVSNIGNQGIVIGNANGSAIERNVVRAAGQVAPANGEQYGPGGLWFVASRDSFIRFNEVSEMGNSGAPGDGAGINIDWYCTNITVQYNQSYNNSGNGFTTMSNNGGKILNNKAYGNRGEQHNGDGQIALGNFTARRDLMTGAKNMVVAYNTIIVDVAGTTGVNTTFMDDGVTPIAGLWTGNSIYRNNIVLKSGTSTSVFDIDTNATIDQIWENKIYSSGSTFTAKKNGTTYSGLWNWQSATTFDSGSFVYELDANAPGSVSGLSSTLSGGYVQLSWSAATDSGSGIAHYNIYRGTTPSFTPAYANMVGESTATSFLDNARPKSNTTYYYKVQAEDRNGNNGSASAALTATTGLIP